MQPIVDPMWGLSNLTKTAAYHLCQEEPTFADYDELRRAYDITLKTSVFYIGTQGRVAITMWPGSNPQGICQVVSFGGTGVSDSIVVTNYEPTILDNQVPQPEVLTPKERVELERSRILEVVPVVQGFLKGAYLYLRQPMASLVDSSQG